MERIGIIGGGIAGLTAAYRLQHHFDITLFEAESVLGGHARTVISPKGNPINPQVINFTRPVYPEYFALMDEIGFDGFRPAPVSVVVHQNGDIMHADVPIDLKLFVRNLPIYLDLRSAPSFRHWLRFFRFLYRFWRDYKSGRFPPELPVEQLEAYYPDHVDVIRFWAMPFAMLKTVITLTVNDLAYLLFGGLNLRSILDKDLAVTLDGPVTAYIELLASKTRADFRVDCPVERLARRDDGQLEVTVRGETHLFDRVIVATQPLAVPRFLEPWNDQQREAFERIAEVYDPAMVVIHTDPSVMCGIPESLWGIGAMNYDPVIQRSAVTIYKRRFCGIDEDIFVTYMEDFDFDLSAAPDWGSMAWQDLPEGFRLDPGSVWDAVKVSHPMFGKPVQRATFDRIVELSGRDELYFVGVGLDGRHRVGHEGAVASANVVARAILDG